MAILRGSNRRRMYEEGPVEFCGEEMKPFVALDESRLFGTGFHLDPVSGIAVSAPIKEDGKISVKAKVRWWFRVSRFIHSLF
ncbi:MAG TPA: hypothetical protein PKE06_12275 [Flavilitoribacter sp.]|nr:hypothetical protein [Lewinellaceae bacterium]HMQ61439.1 hypothetical protein [Flavilitoribacter sp.]HMQ86423.1 hypothetical protein [Flavilitoribacter sp.]